MNKVSNVLRINQRTFFRINYSTSSEGHMEPSEMKSNDEEKFEVEEIKIKLPYGGTMAGKWWGDKSVRPIICIHGWQDNAGTFDRLIPLLPKKFSYLALDLPGHGLSSWIPNGMQYHTTDYLHHIYHLLQEYEWDKITLLGHSLGSILSFVFASVFPEKIELIVGIDALKPGVFNPVKFTEIMGETVKDFVLADKRNQEKSEPPAYSIEEITEKWSKATRGSVTKEAAPYLMKRAIKRSEKHPGKFYFARDSRLKYNIAVNVPQEVSRELAKRINFPYLFIKAKNSPYYERKEYHMEVVEILKQNPKFLYEIVDSTHHVHLTEPEKVSGLISDFLLKHKQEFIQN